MLKIISYSLNIILIGMLIYLNLDRDIKNNLIKVEVKGAVLKSGVYELEEGSTVLDLIKLSGGVKKEADTSFTNLSKRLKNEDVVIIYTKDEIEEMQSGNTSIKYIEKECFCPKLENASCIQDIIDSSESIINNTSKVSLNTSSLEELLTIPGIGEAKAKAIIEYRNNTSFKTIEDIMNVKGISSGLFEKIKDYLTI